MGQKVLITAVASGIGLEIARAFSSTGAMVFITDINMQAIDAAKQEIPGLLATLCDNSKRSDIEKMVVPLQPGRVNSLYTSRSIFNAPLQMRRFGAYIASPKWRSSSFGSASKAGKSAFVLLAAGSAFQSPTRSYWWFGA